MNEELIYESLYIINKSAKKSRDTANSHSNTRIQKRCRNRKNKLYQLKHEVLEKLYQEKKLIKKGIHIQKIKENSYFFLTYFISESGWSYHRPATKEELNELKNGILKEMSIVPAKIQRNSDLSYKKAIQICEEYLKENNKNLSKIHHIWKFQKN